MRCNRCGQKIKNGFSGRAAICSKCVRHIRNGYNEDELTSIVYHDPKNKIVNLPDNRYD